MISSGLAGRPYLSRTDALQAAGVSGLSSASYWAAQERRSRLAEQPREDAPLSATVLRPGSVQRVNAVDEEMDEEAGALSTW